MKSPTTSPFGNPFIINRRLSPEFFIGRESLLESIFSLIENQSSVMLVGEPKIGKTSILHFMCHMATQARYLNPSQKHYIFYYIDGHLLSSDTTPKKFWRHLLAELLGFQIGEQSSKLVEKYLKKNTYNPFEISTIFMSLARNCNYLVIYFDEFDSIINNKSLSVSDFFGPLRSFCTNTLAVSLIATSRLDLSSMTRYLQSPGNGGSPILNHLIEKILPPFTRDEIYQLFELYLDNQTIRFSQQELEFITQLTGGLPYLVQLVGYHLLERPSKEEGWLGKYIPDELDSMTSAYFSDLWRALSVEAQGTLRLLLPTVLSSVPRTDAAMPAAPLALASTTMGLETLKKRGLIQATDMSRTAPLSKGSPRSHWRISSELFARWVATHEAGYASPGAKFLLQGISLPNPSTANEAGYAPSAVSPLRLINALCPTDLDLSAFLRDHFPDIELHLGILGTDAVRDRKISFLFEKKSAASIADALSNWILRVLSSMIESQLRQVVMLAGVNSSYLPSSVASVSIVASELVRISKQNPDGLRKLVLAIREVDPKLI